MDGFVHLFHGMEMGKEDVRFRIETCERCGKAAGNGWSIDAREYIERV